MALLSSSAVSKVYKSGGTEFVALDNVSVEIEKGEAVAITGKSGSGKSTLMHLLALLDEPDSGEISLNGMSTKSMKSQKLSKVRNETFGFVFQQFFLNPNETVLENTVLPLEIAGMPLAERNKLGEEILGQLGLGAKLQNKAVDLSGGQKQRVAIARALINKPQVIFADEPTGNLDSKTGKQVEEILFDLNKNQGITLVCVTHDPEFAAKFDRTIEVADGRISGQSNASPVDEDIAALIERSVKDAVSRVVAEILSKNGEK
jgi:putative ABC transport system ATP-binding protein